MFCCKPLRGEGWNGSWILIRLLAIALGVGSHVCSDEKLCAAQSPNVVLIMTDDQSWDSIGFLGGKVHTPRIDRMAREGLYLSNFNVTSTVCSPSRYSFLTGRYAGRCEGKRFIEEHPPGEQTQVENIGELEGHRWNLAKVLQRNGYRTGFVGKSHVVRHDWLGTLGPRRSGELDTYPHDADPRDPAIQASMRRNHEHWCAAMREQGFDFADAIYGANLKELQNESLNVHNLDWTVSKALDFLNTSKEEPFFLFFSTTLHHGPAPWNHRFSLEADPRMTGEGFVSEGFDVLPDRADVLRRNRAAGFRDRDAYALWLDDGVGALLDKLKGKGIEEDTLVVFMPDHGSYRHGKATLHDFGMRVPMILQWKGTIEAGTVYDGLVANIDLAPTLLEICGVEIPIDYQIDGVSFSSVLKGSMDPVRSWVFGELGHSRAVKTEAWKYIAVRYPKELQARVDRGEPFRGFMGETLPRPYLTRNRHLGHYASKANPHYFESDQLYDLRSDPEETRNVYADHPVVAEKMRRLLKVALSAFEGRPFGEFAR